MLLDWLNSKRLSFLLALELFSVYGGQPFIQERPAVIEQIKKSLSENNCINLYGLSGMGKTCIANEFAKKWVKEGGSLVVLVWESHSIDEQIENAIKALGGNRAQKSDLVSMFINAIKTTKKTLVVIDNYNECSETALSQKLPGFLELNNAKIIIVSQKKLRKEGIQCPPFTPIEAITLIKKFLPSEKAERIEKIAELFSYYPYYIVMVCKFLTTSNTFDTVRIQENVEKNTAGRFLMESAFPSNQDNLQKTVGHSVICGMLNELRAQNSEALECLGFLSCVASKNIPLRLIQLFVGDDKKADQIIESLINQSLISYVNKNTDFISYDIHDISRGIVAGELTDKEKKDICAKGVKSLCLFFKQNFSKVYDANREDQVFYSHLMEFLEFFKASKDVLPLKILALKRLLYSRQNLKKAKEDSLQLEGMKPEVKITDSDILFEYYTDSAFINCFHHTGEDTVFQKGKDLALRSLRIAESQKDKEKMFKACTRLVWIQLYSGELEGALPYLEKAEALLPNNQNSCALKEFYFTASWYFIEEGKFDKGYFYAKKGIKIDGDSKDANTGLYLRSNLALCEYRLKKYEDATITIRDALERESIVFGGKSLARAEMLQIEALLMIEKKDFHQAEISIRESLAIFEKVRGNDAYLSQALSMKTLADILFYKDRLGEAKDIMIRSLDMYKKLIKDSPTFEFGEAFVLMGQISLSLKDFETLRSTYKELESRFGLENEHTKKLLLIVANENKDWVLS